MEALVLNTALDPALLVADRDEWVERVCAWIEDETDKMIRWSYSDDKRMRKILKQGRLTTSEWGYHSGDVRYKAHFPPKLTIVADPESCANIARSVWKRALKTWPEVLRKKEYDAFCAEHRAKVDTKPLSADQFAELMRKRSYGEDT